MKEAFKSIKLVHVKREYNQAADYLTSKTLMLGESWTIDDQAELTHLEQVSRIREKLMKPVQDRVTLADSTDPGPGPESAPLPMAARVMAAITRSHRQEEPERGEPMDTLEYQAERWRRIKAHQDADPELMNLKKFLRGELEGFSRMEIQKISKKADLYALDVRGVLYRLSRSTQDRPRDMTDELRLVVPEGLRPDMLHYAHEDFQGGHQGITRTFEKLRTEFYWHGMHSDVEDHVKEGTDCASGKGQPWNPGPSPGNIEPRRPFEVVSMDFVTRLPKSNRGNTFLLLFQDAFSGYVMCKPMSSTTAQDVAEAYEEVVFRHFGASSLIRHDQDPRFMSEVFARFRELLESKQRATLGYRPQAYGQQERSVQTVVRSIRAYVAEADQSDWDEHAERLMFALNTSFDATRLDTPFYLVHGWDAKSTLSAMLGPKPSNVPERNAYEWRRKLQRDYGYAQACAEDLQKKAKRLRSDEQTRKWKELSDRLKTGFDVGDAVWLYIPKVQPGLSRKLAHLWHGPFRIAEVQDDFRVRLKVEGTGYMAMIGAVGMVIGHLFAAILFTAICDGNVDDSGYPTVGGWFICIGTAFFVFSYAVSWGALPWIYCSEIFPLNVRASAVSVATAANWIGGALMTEVVKLFLYLNINGVSSCSPLSRYCAVCLSTSTAPRPRAFCSKISRRCSVAATIRSPRRRTSRSRPLWQ